MKSPKHVIFAGAIATYIVVAVALALVLRSAIVGPADDSTTAKANKPVEEKAEEKTKISSPPIAVVTVRRNGKETSYRVANPDADSDRQAADD